MRFQKRRRQRPHPCVQTQLRSRAGRQQVLTKLQEHVMAELGFAEPIDPDRPLNEVGLDSLMSVKLANSLEKEFGIPIPVA